MNALLVTIHENYVIIALFYARMVPIFLIVPILNSGVLSSMLIRNAIIFAIGIGLWPMIVPTMHISPDIGLLETALLVARESIIGMSMGMSLALPFWIFNAMGAFIDVARGSSMGALIDPTSGQESTEMQNFINFCICVLYMQMGGLNVLLETLVQSYAKIGMGGSVDITLTSVFLFLTQIFEHGFILAAPVLLTLLLSEALLGLLSRFTPQLSAFSVAMTIKSVIAIFVVSLYFFQIAPDRLPVLTQQYSQWSFVTGGASR